MKRKKDNNNLLVINLLFFCITFCAAAGLDLSRTEAVGCGRACQRPRTSSGAKCFSCEGALAKNLQIFKFFEVYTAAFFQNPCCAARGHALAVCNPPHFVLRTNSLRAAQQKNCLFIFF